MLSDKHYICTVLWNVLNLHGLLYGCSLLSTEGIILSWYFIFIFKFINLRQAGLELGDPSQLIGAGITGVSHHTLLLSFVRILRLGEVTSLMLHSK